MKSTDKMDSCVSPYYSNCTVLIGYIQQVSHVGELIRGEKTREGTKLTIHIQYYIYIKGMDTL